MKKRVIALLLVGLLLLGSGCYKATLSGYKLYRSTPLGFSMEYPDFWSTSTDRKEGLAVFVTPSEGYSDEYNESLSVQRLVPSDEENAFETYVREYVGTLESTFKNYKLVSEEDTTLSGSLAYRIVYESTADDGSSEMRFMQIFAENKGRIYVISYMAEFGSYTYFLSYVDKMLSTFRYL